MKFNVLNINCKYKYNYYLDFFYVATFHSVQIIDELYQLKGTEIFTNYYDHLKNKV